MLLTPIVMIARPFAHKYWMSCARSKQTVNGAIENMYRTSTQNDHSCQLALGLLVKLNGSK